MRAALSRPAVCLALFVTAACGSEEAPTAAAPATPVVEPSPEVALPASAPEPSVEPPAPAVAPLRLRAGDADRPRMAIGESRGLAVIAGGRVVEFPLSPSAGSAIATPVDGVERAETVAVGWAVACAVTSEHRVVCWTRRGARGGVGTVEGIGSVAQPVEGLTDAQAVVVTSEAVCARDDHGVVTCLGAGLLDRRRGPGGAFTLALPSPAIQIAAGAYGVCAVLDDGAVSCAGTIGGRFFTGSGAARSVRTPFAVGSLAMHDGNLCVRSVDGDSVACGGDVGEWYYEDVDFEDDERGPVSAMEADVPELTNVDLPAGAVALASNVNEACAIMRGGGLRCWGTPYRDGRTEGFVSRAAVGMHGVSELVAGGADRRGYTCAIQGDLPVCFTSERVLGHGTPGATRFPICSREAPGGACVELRLVTRGPVAAGTVTANTASPVPTETPAAALAEVRCVVADPSGTPLNVRAEATARAEVVGTLANGADVTTDGSRGRFRHLTTPLVGWAWADNLACP